jgi:[acyl-carrier-protein] S-malonyltransferase
VVCNVTAELLPSEEAARTLLVQQLTSSVRWVETLRRLAELGAMRFLEFGSGTVLTGLLGRTLEGVRGACVHDPESLAAVLVEEAA